jgi:hypothetical protein
MENDHDMFMHFWSQWMPRLIGEGEFLQCKDFKWSNNPALFKKKALIAKGTLPLDAEKDGAKGTANWTNAEVGAERPPNAYIHHWGMFMHEVMEDERYPEMVGCGKFPAKGNSTCKYGFYKDGSDRFCRQCDLRKGREDMPAHEKRMRMLHSTRNETMALGTIVHKEYGAMEKYLTPCLSNEKLSDIMIEESEDGVSISTIYNKIIDKKTGRFLILCHPDVSFSQDVYKHVREQLSRPEVGVVGLVGSSDDGRQVWAQNLNLPEKVSSLDGCFIAIDLNKGLRFDEETFDGLHCYAEDLCYQARDRGLKVVCLPALEFKHASDTFNKEGAAWGNYWEYRGRLEGKWYNKFKVVTT